ncbi:hypothetical protein FISHEDRAFT_75642 [Fistulina hepatica ATCC 64428]|uniref:Uncharacterized protein n=1 Tax=Fistulina hepatica ATCC 64428 TaxID=1128425 RepID=A0A0D7A7P9_9AGAR|nr:hypothetical protein FISHEDRAFT_75642 [Fistulina hepatica ATCC 64428]
MVAGQALADVSMFMEMTVVLASFHISFYLDEDGKTHLPNAVGRLPGTIRLVVDQPRLVYAALIVYF